MAEEKEVMGIYKKMLAVMKKVGYVEMDGVVDFTSKTGKRTKYRFLTEEKLTQLIRDELVEQGIIVYPIIQEHNRDGQLSIVDTTYRFVDVADGSFLDAVSSGTGMDGQDKGVGMAMTHSYKYLFRRTFAIPTGEDPDKISSAELDDKEKAHRVAKGKTSILQLLEDNPDLSEDFKTATRMDVDIAVGKDDVGTLEIIFKEVKAEIRKLNAPEARNATKENFAEVAHQRAKDKKQEPHLPESTDGDLDIF
jgi:hypothetical protein